MDKGWTWAGSKYGKHGGRVIINIWGNRPYNILSSMLTHIIGSALLYTILETNAFAMRCQNREKQLNPISNIFEKVHHLKMTNWKTKQADCVTYPLYGEPYVGSTLDVMTLSTATSTCNVDHKIWRHPKTQIVIHAITSSRCVVCNVYHFGMFLTDVKKCCEEACAHYVLAGEVVDCDIKSYLYKKNIELPMNDRENGFGGRSHLPYGGKWRVRH